MNVIEGKMTQDGIKVGIVVARFNEFITSKLLGGAKDGLVRHDVPEENIDVAWVPGAFEIPLIAKKMAKVTKNQQSSASCQCKKTKKKAFRYNFSNLWER